MPNTLSPKDPADILDYLAPWATWLGSDTILTSTWIIPAGLTLVSQSNTPTTATVFLSGGVVGQSYRITNVITTATGRTARRSAQLYVEST